MIELLQKYIPGIEWLVLILFIHLMTATIAHIKAKDFSFKEWPLYMTNFITFCICISIINGVLGIAQLKIRNSMLITLFTGFQALVYGQAFLYYIDNILQHLVELGVPITPELTESIKKGSTFIKNLIGIR